jgi:hypothetical protein
MAFPFYAGYGAVLLLKACDQSLQAGHFGHISHPRERVYPLPQSEDFLFRALPVCFLCFHSLTAFAEPAHPKRV